MIKKDLLLVSVFAAVENWERIKHCLQFGHHLLGLIWVFLNDISDTVFIRAVDLLSCRNVIQTFWVTDWEEVSVRPIMTSEISSESWCDLLSEKQRLCLRLWDSLSYLIGVKREGLIDAEGLTKLGSVFSN